MKGGHSHECQRRCADKISTFCIYATLWVTPEALSGWAAPRRKTRGGRPLYSDLAIETTLTLGMVFGLQLCQSEGLLSSVLDVVARDLPVPDHTTLSRRARTWKPTAIGNDRQHAADGPIHILVDSNGAQGPNLGPSEAVVFRL
jgi:hypothetical protein